LIALAQGHQSKALLAFVARYQGGQDGQEAPTL
jgi:hypothetical protein